MAKIDKTIKDIRTLLKKDRRGLTIQEISELTRVSRITARMALLHLEGAGEIELRKIGNCSLHYAKQ